MAGVWRDIVLKTIRETPSKTKEGSGYGLYIIQRVCDEKSFSVTVRSGSYRTDAVSGEKVYPRDGLNIYDFNAIRPIYKQEIEPMLEIKKGTPVAQSEAPPPEPEPEMPPW